MEPDNTTGSSPQRVDIVDIDIPWSSLVLFMFKLALASIPVGLVMVWFWYIVLRLFGIVQK